MRRSPRRFRPTGRRCKVGDPLLEATACGAKATGAGVDEEAANKLRVVQRKLQGDASPGGRADDVDRRVEFRREHRRVVPGELLHRRSRGEVRPAVDNVHGERVAKETEATDHGGDAHSPARRVCRRQGRQSQEAARSSSEAYIGQTIP